MSVKTSVWLRNPKTFVKGLGPEHFSVSAASEPLELKCFSTLNRPLNIGLVIDFSESEKKSLLEETIRAIRIFIEESHPESNFFILGFNSEPFLLLDATNERTLIEKALSEASSRKREGKTAFYDGLLMGLGKFTAMDEKDQVLITFSDAVDNHSVAGIEATKRKLRQSRVRSFVIRRVDRREPIIQTEMFGRMDLSKLLAENAGVLYSIDVKDDLSESLKNLAVRMKTEYTIGFDPKKQKREFHKMEISVKTPNSLGSVYVSGPKYFFY